MQARDDLGNRRLTGGDEFVVELRGPSSVYASVKDGGDGTYAAVLSTTVSGDHLVHITLGMLLLAACAYGTAKMQTHAFCLLQGRLVVC